LRFIGAAAQNGFNCPDFSQRASSRQSYLAGSVNDYGTPDAESRASPPGLKALWIDLRGWIGDAAHPKRFEAILPLMGSAPP
jgi:hypothetical protein